MCLLTLGLKLEPNRRYKTVIWELRLDEPADHPSTKLDFRMGFFSEAIRDSPSYRVRGFVRHSANISDPVSSDEDSDDEESQERTCSPCYGHRYALVFDFDQKEVSFWHNDQGIAVIYGSVEHSATPFVAFFTQRGRKTMATCTKW